MQILRRKKRQKCVSTKNTIKSQFFQKQKNTVYMCKNHK